MLNRIKKNVCCVVLSLGSVFSMYGHADSEPADKHIWFAASDEGVYHGQFSQETGELSALRQVVSGKNSDYLVQHPRLRILYSVSRKGDFSSIVSYQIAEDGSLSLQSELTGRPRDGAHININKAGTLLTVAYYSGGVIGMYNIKADGSIGEVASEILHTGTGPNKARQEAPHPHWSGFSKDQRFLYVTDLGNDAIWIYAIKNNALVLSEKVSTAAGAGPRHMAFHPTKDFAFVTDELDHKVTAYSVNPRTGSLAKIASYEGAGGAHEELWANVSDLRVHPNGQFLYVVNRGFDRVVVFSINQDTGTLKPVEREPVRGSISRNIIIIGEWALVASRQPGTVAVFNIVESSGELQFKRGHAYSVPLVRSILIDGYIN